MVTRKDALTALVDIWRQEALAEDTEGNHFLTKCADELAALLAAEEEPQGVYNGRAGIGQCGTCRSFIPHLCDRSKP